MLRVLDAPPQVLLIRMLPKNRLVQIQHLAVRPIPNRVRAKLKSVVDCQLRRLLDVRQIFRVDPAPIRRAGRKIRIRRQ